MHEVEAAGCVVWRPATSEDRATGAEVLVVHRPRYDDWSFPKGKLEAGESFLHGAVREVEEETGCTGRIGAALESVTYVDHKGRNKIVRYWLMVADVSFDADTFEPNEEVDELSWMGIDDARSALSYAHDVVLLDQAVDLIPEHLIPEHLIPEHLIPEHLIPEQ